MPAYTILQDKTIIHLVGLISINGSPLAVCKFDIFGGIRFPMKGVEIVDGTFKN
jgi:hypothetical protein